MTPTLSPLSHRPSRLGLPRTRRAWLAANARLALLAAVAARPLRGVSPAGRARRASQTLPVDPESWDALATRAIDAARAAGAQYADVRLQRTLMTNYQFQAAWGMSGGDVERVGVGVRALVDGYWGFAACPSADAEAIVRLAKEAVAMARTSGAGMPQTVDLGTYPAATGRWTTPVKIDPFTIPIEEKRDYIEYWKMYAQRAGQPILTIRSSLVFARREEVVATTDGTLVAQTCIESGGTIDQGDMQVMILVDGLEPAGKGWELFTEEVDIPAQLDLGVERYVAERELQKTMRPATIGRYTLVLDGMTMAGVVDRTIGVATQLDRALGWEANAVGTSFLTDPLGMLGQFRVASPLVTVTANRSAPGQLATVQWDTEGMRPEPFTLVQDGILHDFQTTRELAATLAPYYQRKGVPVRSHGCAAAPEALSITMEHPPNLALQPGAANTRVEDLVANVEDGILITEGTVQADFQASGGVLHAMPPGKMREIKRGKVGRLLGGGTGAIMFQTLDFWKHVTAVGGASTQQVKGLSEYFFYYYSYNSHPPDWKGQPVQWTSHSTSGVAALVTNQAMINPMKQA